MSVYRWDGIPVEFADESIGETRSVRTGDMTLSFERLKAGFTTEPFAKGLPDDCCQCPHWGIVLEGRITIRSAAGDETVEAGSAYHMAPGHNVIVEEDVSLVELSPAHDRQVTLEHFERMAVELMQA